MIRADDNLTTWEHLVDLIGRDSLADYQCEFLNQVEIGNAPIYIMRGRGAPGRKLYLRGEVVRELITALKQARFAICKAAEDTLWCNDVPAETIVDRIDHALERAGA